MQCLIDSSIINSKNRKMEISIFHILLWIIVPCAQGQLLNNLIIQGDFENMTPVLTLSNSYSFPEHYSYQILPSGTYGWYTNTGFIQVRTKENLNTIVIDTLAKSSIDTFCQNVIINPELSEHAFRLSFDYVVDLNTPQADLGLYWNNKLLYSTVVTNQDSRNFATSVFPSPESSVNSVCFYCQSKIGKFLGYLLDNVTLTTFMTNYIYFSITPNTTKINTLTLISNFTVENIDDLLVIANSTSITINGKQAKVVDAYVRGQLSLLVLQVEYYEQFYTQSPFIINLPELIIKNKYGYQVDFVETCSALPKIYHYSKQSENFITPMRSFLTDQMKYSLMSFSVISIVGFSVFMIRFICFSNIIIFFVFLDIPMMIAPVRVILHEVCSLVLGQSTIELFLKLIGSPINAQIFEESHYQLTEKVPYFHLHGMEFRDIGLTSHFYNNSIGNFSTYAFNLIKIALICFFIKFKRFQPLKVKFNQKITEIILFQFLSLGPSFAPVSGIMLSTFSNISSIKIAEKINAVFQILPPISLTFIAILLFFDFRKLKLSRLPKSPPSPLKQNLQQMEEKQMVTRKHFITKKNTTVRHLCKFKVLQFLTFVLIPFLAGLQSNIVFLCCVTAIFIFKIGSVVKSKSIMGNCEYYPLLLVKIIELLICFIIVYLYVFDLLMVSPQIQACGIKIGAALCLSLPVLYMIGCAIEFLIDSVEIILGIFATIKEICCSRKIKDEKIIVIDGIKQENIHRALSRKLEPIKNLSQIEQLKGKKDKASLWTKMKEVRFENSLYRRYKWRKTRNLKMRDKIKESTQEWKQNIRSKQTRESEQVLVQIFIKQNPQFKETMTVESYKE